MERHPVSTVYLLKQTELAVRSCVEVALAEVDVTPSQYFILFLVKFGQATSAAELARATGVLPQSMTELISPLEKTRAIVRRPDSNNNRILRIELTSAGERLFTKATEIAIQLERELLEGFDVRALERLNDALFELKAKAEAHSYHPRIRRLSKPVAKTPAARAPRKSARARRAGVRR